MKKVGDLPPRAKFKCKCRPPVKFKQGNNSMMLKWFKAREATEIGTALADQFASRTVSDLAEGGKRAAPTDASEALQDLLKRADREVRSLQLNVYKKAK